MSSLDFMTHTGITVLSRQVGRIKVRIVCPFCQADVEGYLWSIAGSGKKCSCGAIIGQTGAWKGFPVKAPRR